MGRLDDYVRSIAEDFSKNYRTARNPDGKEFIVIHGGEAEFRLDFSHLVRVALPIGVEAYVVEQESRRLPRERGDDPRASYVNLDELNLSAGYSHGERA